MDVDIRPWAEGDLGLLERLMGDPEMMRYLGGPESLEQIRKRHKRYLAIDGSGRGHMFVIVVGPERVPAGSVGYWERTGREETVWETGWSVLPEFQGGGIATRGTALAIEHARAGGRRRFMHAYPSVDNAPSNAICRKLGFTLLGEDEFEYPPGNTIRCNDWRLDLLSLGNTDQGLGIRTSSVCWGREREAAMTATALVTELGKIAERVQDQATNEDSPYRGKPILDETSRGKALDELRSNVIQTRREMVDSVASLPAGAFETQPAGADGEPVWSAGEVITHCNGVLMRFTERAATMAGVEAPTWTGEQAASGEQRALDRDAAIAAAELIDLSDWLATIPEDADLETTVDHPAFGKLSGRAWLHFIAVHEANHVEQLEELSAANT